MLSEPAGAAGNRDRAPGSPFAEGAMAGARGDRRAVRTRRAGEHRMTGQTHAPSLALPTDRQVHDRIAFTRRLFARTLGPWASDVLALRRDDARCAARRDALSVIGAASDRRAA
jgi:hypothetical protein